MPPKFFHLRPYMKNLDLWVFGGESKLGENPHKIESHEPKTEKVLCEEHVTEKLSKMSVCALFTWRIPQKTTWTNQTTDNTKQKWHLLKEMVSTKYGSNFMVTNSTFEPFFRLMTLLTLTRSTLDVVIKFLTLTSTTLLFQIWTLSDGYCSVDENFNQEKQHFIKNHVKFSSLL